MKLSDFYQWQDDSLILKIYVQPNAKKSEVVGLYDGALKIRLAAPAVEGKANVELINFLASYFNIPKSIINLLHGAQGRHKRVRIMIAKDRQNEINRLLQSIL